MVGLLHEQKISSHFVCIIKDFKGKVTPTKLKKVLFGGGRSFL